MANWKHVILGITVAAGGVVLARVVSAHAHELRLRAIQERAYRAAQFEVWMDLFQERFCGEPQPVDEPVAIEQDPVKLQQMKDVAIRRIEDHHKAISD